MRQLHLRLPIPPVLERSPELAPLAILDVALTACEAALLVSYAEIHHGAIEDSPRGSSVLRANAIITLARRLAAAIAAYRDAVDRDALRADRERRREPF
ncbi:MAG: hypothetical protein ACYC8T_23600 [Myxococcaceae bacterium]